MKTSISLISRLSSPNDNATLVQMILGHIIKNWSAIT